MKKLKEGLKENISLFYSKIFGKEPGPVAMNFIKNLGIVFGGLTIAKVLSVIFQIYVGRTLGPLDYGKYVLVIAVSQLLYSPMLLGTATGLTKYLSEKKDEHERKLIFSTTMFLIAFLIFTSSFIFLVLRAKIATLLSLNVNFVYAALLLAIFYSLWQTAIKTLQGLDKFKKISLLNVIWSLCIVFFAILLFTYQKNARIPVIALLLGYLISSSVMAPEFFKHFRFKIDIKWVKILVGYGFFIFLGSILISINGNVDRIFINKFLTIADVGVYHAYYFSTMGVTGFIIGGFATVFFPEASAYEDRPSLLKQINKLIRIAPLLYIIACLLSFTIILLYGKEYPITLQVILSFSFASVVFFFYSLYNWFSASIGVRGVKANLYALLLISFLNVLLAYTLIPLLGIHGAIISLIVSYTAGLFFLYYLIIRIV